MSGAPSLRLLLIVALAGCTPLRERPPAGRLDAGEAPLDAGASDLDASFPFDAPALDAPPPDGGAPDAGTPDGGATDAGVTPPCTGCIAAGVNHACAIRPTGHVSCWGGNGYGQLGDGTTANRSTPIEVLVIGDAVQVAAGDFHTCAVRAGGGVACWGANQYGRLGDGTTVDSSAPRDVAGVIDAVQIAAGSHFSCALLRDETVRCWGANGYGQLGIGTTAASSPAAVPIPGLAGVVHIAAGALHACAVRRDGTAACWGANGAGQLGDGTTTLRRSPVEVLTSGLAEVACGGDHLSGHHTCAARDDGTVACWGANPSGQVGDGTITGRIRPVEVAGLGGVAHVSTGTAHSCAVSRDGVVHCWGANGSGRLGDATTTGRRVPTPVAVAHSYREVAAGGQHTCALTADGAWCWGANVSGQLGDGTSTARSAPTAVAGFP